MHESPNAKLNAKPNATQNTKPNTKPIVIQRKITPNAIPNQ
jgi:hypothetical protein